MEVQNLECHSEVGALVRKEINVVLEAVKRSLRDVWTDDLAGTFILDGQVNGGEARCVLRFNLPAGGYEVSHLYDLGKEKYLGPCRTSDNLAEESIDGVLEWPKNPRYRCLRRYRTSEKIPSGIYEEGELVVLVLKTMRGRFLMSLKLASCSICKQNAAGGYARLAMSSAMATLARMAPKDRVLQRNWKELSSKIEANLDWYTIFPSEMLVFENLDAKLLFDNGSENVVMSQWKDWYSRNYAEQPRIFF